MISSISETSTVEAAMRTRRRSIRTKTNKTASQLSKRRKIHYVWITYLDASKCIQLLKSEGGGYCKQGPFNVDSILIRLSCLGRSFWSADLKEILKLRDANTARFILAILLEERLIEVDPDQRKSVRGKSYQYRMATSFSPQVH